MAYPSTSRLLEWLQRKKGDHLRVVGRYDSTDVEWVYRRPDVRAAYSESGFEESAETYRQIAPIIEELSEILHAGDHRATVNVYDELVLIQYALGPDQGVVVSFDPPVGEDMVEIVTDGLQLLLGDQEELEEDPPDWAESDVD